MHENRFCTNVLYQLCHATCPWESLQNVIYLRHLQNPDSVSDFSHFGAKFEVRARHFWQDEVLQKSSNACQMDTISRELIMQCWNVIQHELIPELRNDVGSLTPKLEKVIHILEWARIEEFTGPGWCGVGRHPHERAWLANPLWQRQYWDW